MDNKFNNLKVNDQSAMDRNNASFDDKNIEPTLSFKDLSECLKGYMDK